MVHAIPEAVGHDENARGQRQAGNGEERLHGTALEVADGDAEGVRKQVGDAGALDESRPVVGRRLGPHRLSRREARRPADRAEHARRGRRSADQQRQWKGGAIGAKGQVGEPEEGVIHQHQPMAQQHPTTAPQHSAARDDHKGELEIVNHDLPVGEAEGFHDGNLLPLQSQQPRQHRVDHECRHTQEHHREAYGHRRQHTDLVRDPDVRGVIGPPVSAASAILRQQAVQLCDDGTLRRTRLKRERQVVERAV